MAMRKNLQAARELNEVLIQRGDQQAIKRKIDALIQGGDARPYGIDVPHYRRPGDYPTYGYEKNPEAVWELNDILAKRGDKEAISRKIEGLTRGGDTYQKRSVYGGSAYGKPFTHYYPSYGYKKNPEAAREFNDILVEEGDQQAITRKIEGLTRGGDIYHQNEVVQSVTHCYPTYGYEKNPQAAREFNEILVERGDQEASTRKWLGLMRGGDSYQAFERLRPVTHYYPTCGYEKNPQAAREFNEVLIKKGDRRAIGRKIWGLLNGTNSYEKNLKAAKDLNDILVERDDQEAIKSKENGLLNGNYGYEKNLEAAKEFEEFIKILPFLSKVLNKYTPLPKDIQAIILRYIHRSIK
jgi:hypothetical protein